MSDKIGEIRERHRATMMSHKQTESAIWDLCYDRETLLAEVDRQRAENERLREANRQLVSVIYTITRRKQEENERLREALRDIERGDYSDPMCERTPEQRARAALEGKP